MQTYRPVSPESMMMFSKREADGPRCIHCGQRFQLSFSGGRVVEQRCGCGIVYSVEAMGTLQFIDTGEGAGKLVS